MKFWIHCLIALSLFECLLKADTRSIIFKNVTREVAHDLHLAFAAPVHVDLPGAISVPTGAKAGTVPFEDDDVEGEGTIHNFWGGSVPGKNEDGSGQGSSIRIRFRSEGDTNIVLTNWFWARADRTAIPHAAGAVEHSLPDNGRKKLFAALGGTAAGTGWIQVAIAGITRTFATVPGASPQETLSAFRAFLSGYESEGTPLIYIPERAFGERVVFSGNVLGDPYNELAVEVLSTDTGQVLWVSDFSRFEAADVNKDFKIQAFEITDLTARWWAGDPLVTAADLTRGLWFWGSETEGYLPTSGEEPLQNIPEGDVLKGISITNNSGEPAADLHLLFVYSGGVTVDPNSVSAENCPNSPNVKGNGTNEIDIEWDANCVKSGKPVKLEVQSFPTAEIHSGYWTRLVGNPPNQTRERIADIDPKRDVTYD